MGERDVVGLELRVVASSLPVRSFPQTSCAKLPSPLGEQKLKSLSQLIRRGRGTALGADI